MQIVRHRKEIMVLHQRLVLEKDFESSLSGTRCITECKKTRDERGVINRGMGHKMKVDSRECRYEEK